MPFLYEVKWHKKEAKVSIVTITNPRPSSASSCLKEMSPPLPRLLPETLLALSILSLRYCDDGEGGGWCFDGPDGTPNRPPAADADRDTDR